MLYIWKGKSVIKVETTRFKTIEVDENDVITLPSGLVGFPELKQYVLLDHDENSPFKWLQSLDDGAIAFVLINPLLFRPDFTVEVNEAEVVDLGLDNEEDAVISVIITMPSDPQKMTANLKAPLVFNLKNRKGRQVILNNSEYTTKHLILDEVKSRSANLTGEQLKEAVQKQGPAGQSEVAKK